MKRIRYSKYVPDAAGEMSMEDLLSALSDYLLQSGFQNYMYYDLPEGERTLDDLRVSRRMEKRKDREHGNSDGVHTPSSS